MKAVYLQRMPTRVQRFGREGPDPEVGVHFFAVFRIHMFLGLPDQDPLVRGMDPSIIKQN